MISAQAPDACRFAPIVALDADGSGRPPLFALEVSAHRDARTRLTCAIDALVSARRAQPRQRPIAVMVPLALDELAGLDVDALTAPLAPAGVPADLLMVRVPRYTAGAKAALLERIAATGVTVIASSLVVAQGEYAALAGAPVDMIELPPALVDDVDRNRESAGHVEEWVEFAHRIDWLVLARNVRRPSQAAALQRLGCDLAGGPLMGAPVDAGFYRAEPVSGASQLTG